MAKMTYYRSSGHPIGSENDIKGSDLFRIDVDGRQFFPADAAREGVYYQDVEMVFDDGRSAYGHNTKIDLPKGHKPLTQLRIGDQHFHCTPRFYKASNPAQRTVTVHQGVSPELQFACMLEELIVAHLNERADSVGREEVQRVVQWLSQRW